MTGVVGVAFGALLASPLIALCTGSVASADTTDELVSIGPFAIGGSTDTLSLDAAGAFDNYLVGSLNSTTFDLDIFSAGPGSDTSEILFTVPSLFQVGIDDVGGVITPIDSFAPVDAFAPGIGLLDLVNSL